MPQTLGHISTNFHLVWNGHNSVSAAAIQKHEASLERVGRDEQKQTNRLSQTFLDRDTAVRRRRRMPPTLADI